MPVRGTFCFRSALLTFGRELGFALGQTGMPGSDEADTKPTDNVVRLGTETLFAIGEELRRMYEADLRSKPSGELERLMRRIERGDEIKAQPVPVKAERDPQP